MASRYGSVSILHFNDVYRVTPQKLPGTSTDTIDTAQFAALLDDLRDQWPSREDGKRDGLVLFSGDVFSPSVESSVTRGSHMVPVMNLLGPDVSLTGNHDFDFGYPHLSKLIQDTTFPWLLSNVIDTSTSKVPAHLQEFIVLERAGVRIGVVGLVEREWIGTVPSWPANFEWKDMEEVGMDLSRRLRDPNGEHRCDLIIALTHSRIPNDILLAKALKATSPSTHEVALTAESHGVDFILGGHDHLYYVSKGVTAWENYDTNRDILGAEKDQGDVLVVKSGTDFRDLSEFTLELQDTSKGSIRRKLIRSIKGKRHTTAPGSKSSKTLQAVLSKLLASVSKTMQAPVCRTSEPIDVRSEMIRTEESASANLFADIVHHAYDDALCLKSGGGADGVLMCAGTLRGDSVYGPGNVTLGDILEILPFEDPIVVLELDGDTIWNALEAALYTWPAHEGRFPVISGLRVTWDSHKLAGQRVLSVFLQVDRDHDDTNEYGSEQLTPILEEVKREKGGKMYKIVTREYMAQGHDGFIPLKGQKYLIDDEHGQLLSAIVRKYLLGAKYIMKMSQQSTRTTNHLHIETGSILLRAKAQEASTHSPKTADRGRSTVRQFQHSRPAVHYQDPLSIASREHMTEVDCFDGARARTDMKVEKQNPGLSDGDYESELITVHPSVDGRLKDIGRQ